MDKLNYEIKTAKRDFESVLNTLKSEIEHCDINVNVNLTQYTRLLEIAQAKYRTLCTMKGE